MKEENNNNADRRKKYRPGSKDRRRIKRRSNAYRWLVKNLKEKEK